MIGISSEWMESWSGVRDRHLSWFRLRFPPAAGGRQSGPGLCSPEIRGAGRRSQLEWWRRESCPAASRTVRLTAFRNLRDELRFHVAHSAANLLDLLLQLRVRNKPADLREGRLQPGEGGPVDLVEHLLPPLIRRNHEQIELDVGQVG